MGEFRIGRRYAQHVYPDTPQRAPAAFARNYAQTVTPSTLGSGANNVSWTSIEGGGVIPPSIHVPITPNVTGRVRIIATVTLVNSTIAPIDVIEQIQINGAAPPASAPAAAETVDAATGEGSGLATMTLLLDISLPVGPTTQIEIQLTAGTAGLELSAASIELQEVPLATG